MDILPRTAEHYLQQAAGQYPLVMVTGPRQSGKTTLCRTVFPDKRYISLENLDTRQFATDDPRGFLAGLPDGAILDEIQQTPGLLSYIQTIVDADNRRGLFILTGSQQFEITNSISQSLAGRTALLKLLPFSLEELSAQLPIPIDRLLLTGFYPRIWKDNLEPSQALAAYLLSLKNELHVSRDPLRGNLFENMVVIEALKYRLHRGKRSNLHFYRDSNGNEVDLLLGLGPDLYPIEIKAGMTINRDYFKGAGTLFRPFFHSARARIDPWRRRNATTKWDLRLSSPPASHPAGAS